jgi:putative DNA primase/helicase
LLVTFTNTVSANNKPRIGTDHGIQRRMQVVPWEVIIPDERADPAAQDEAEGRGERHPQPHGAGRAALPDQRPADPEAIKEATREYHQENDILGQFLELAVERVPGERSAPANITGCSPHGRPGRSCCRRPASHGRPST